MLITNCGRERHQRGTIHSWSESRYVSVYKPVIQLFSYHWTERSSRRSIKKQILREQEDAFSREPFKWIHNEGLFIEPPVDMTDYRIRTWIRNNIKVYLFQSWWNFHFRLLRRWMSLVTENCLSATDIFRKRLYYSSRHSLPLCTSGLWQLQLQWCLRHLRVQQVHRLLPFAPRENLYLVNSSQFLQPVTRLSKVNN